MKIDGRAVATGICIIMILSSFGMITSTGQTDDEMLILRIAMQDDIKTMNPLVASDVWTHNVIDYLYDTPIKVDHETDEIVPYIAVGSACSSTELDNVDWSDCTIGDFDYSPSSTWNTSSAKEAIIFYDFETVRWHDLTRMNIRDVLFSYHVQAQLPDKVGDIKCLMDDGGGEDSNYSDTHFLHIYPVWESQDGLRAALKFQLQTPLYGFFSNTLSVMLLPYHIWGTTASGQPHDDMKIWLDSGYFPDYYKAWDRAVALAWDNPTAIGSGPFMFDSWTTGVFIKTVTFRQHFYREEYAYDDPEDPIARQPEIEAIVYRIFKTAEQSVLALKNNDIDYIAWSIPPTFVQEIMNEPDLGVIQSAERGFFYLGYNMRPNRSFGYNEDGEDVGKPLRQAIAHCINKQMIVQRILQNFGLPGDGPISNVSKWYNDTLPQFDFDPAKAKEILADAGYKLEDGSEGQEAIDKAGDGNWWVNPDGTPIGSSEGGKIKILTPPADYDPVVAGRGLIIASQMRRIGLNADSIAMDYVTIAEYVEKRDFDMYLHNWEIDSEPFDFMYHFFHSDTAQAGQNYPGYSNESYDKIIDLARETADEEVRLKCIQDAQASIAYDRPYDVLYFRTNIEAYRSDRFTGWVAGDSGSIYNLDSIYNLKPPSDKWLNARFVNTVSAIESNGTADVEVLVTGLEIAADGTITREPVKDAYVELDVTSGTLAAYEGYTDSTGKFRTVFTAPYTPPTDEFIKNGSHVLIEIKSAELDVYDPASSRVTLVTVYPESVPFISVTMEADPDVIEDRGPSGVPGMTAVVVSVFDHHDNPMANASVVVQTDPKGPEISPETLETDSGGKASFTFQSVNLVEDKEYVVSVIAFKSGYKNGTQSISIVVVNPVYVPVEPPMPGPSVTDIMVALGLIVIIVVAVSAIIFWKRLKP